MFTLLALVVTTAPAFTVLAPGIEYAALEGELHVVRIDPAQARLDVGLASKDGGKLRTAGEWAETKGFAVVINAGMYATDHVSNVGYLKAGDHLNQPRWNAYQSVLAFGPGKAELVDLDAPGAKDTLKAYPTVIQNLRLIRAGGERNVWKENGRRWSEAAIAGDAKGRILFLFSRARVSVKEFNDRLLALPLEITRAMHVEGGPEASLSIRSKALKLDLFGDYESRFRTNSAPWPLPNVIGVSPLP